MAEQEKTQGAPPNALVHQVKIVAELNRYKTAFEQALPRHITADRLARISLTALRKTPKLYMCTLDSFIGSILTAHLFAHVIDNDRVSEVDFLNGDERYKQDWMSDRREYWGIVAYNTQTWKGRSAYLIEKAADYAKRIIRQSKRITTRST